MQSSFNRGIHLLLSQMHLKVAIQIESIQYLYLSPHHAANYKFAKSRNTHKHPHKAKCNASVWPKTASLATLPRINTKFQLSDLQYIIIIRQEANQQMRTAFKWNTIFLISSSHINPQHVTRAHCQAPQDLPASACCSTAT